MFHVPATAPAQPASKDITAAAKFALMKLKDAVVLPGLKALADIALRVMDLKEDIDNNKEDFAALADRVEDITTTILRAAQDRPGWEMDDKLEEDVDRLQESIASIAAFMKALSKNPISTQAVQNADIAEQIRQKNAELERAFSQFQIASLIDLRMLRSNAAGNGIAGQVPASAIHFSNATIALLPPKPAVFVGRDDLVQSIVAIMTAQPEANAHVAILGAGGMGKTSVATAVLHDPQVIKKFAHHRFFLACDGVTSATAIISLLAVTLKIGRQENTREAVFIHLQMLPQPALLLLDNLESAWDTSDRVNVEQLLESLAGTEMVQIIVTMRGTQRPDGPRWTVFDPLGALDLPAARELFLQIRVESRVDDNLDKLLLALDCWPLAVRLMAKISIPSTSPTELLKQWEEEQTGMLTRGDDHRLSSLDISIKISLGSQVMQQRSALELLTLISLLPDGIQLEWLDEIFPHMLSRRGAVHSLQQTALAYLDTSGTLKVLSPIRMFMTAHHIPQLLHLSDLHHFYMDMTQRLGRVSSDEESRNVIRELGNIQAILKDMITKTKGHDILPIATATLAVAHFVQQAWLIGSCDQLLLSTITELQKQCQPSKTQFTITVTLSILKRLPCTTRRLHLSQALWECLACLGRSLYLQRSYEKSWGLYKEAQGICKQIRSRSGEASCLRSLGDILRMQNQKDEACAMLEEARQMSQKIGDQRGEASCLRSLGDILRVQYQYDEARVVLEQARQMSQKIGDQLGEASCLSSLGDILRMQDQYDQARVVLEEARQMSQKIGDQRGEAWCLRSLGDILRVQYQYDEARVVLEQARQMSQKIGDQLGEAWCLSSLGDILRMQDLYDEACVMLEQARQMSQKIGDQRGEAWCLSSLGDILRMQNLYDEARAMLEEARQMWQKMGDQHGEAWCQKLLEKLPSTAS